jgi:hypothetical protein
VDLDVDTYVSEEYTVVIFRTEAHTAVTTQKTNIDIFTAVKTSNLIPKPSS